MNDDLISREDLKKAISGEFDLAIHNGDIMLMSKSGIVARILAYIDNAPTVENEVTEKQAITKIINSGWLVNHDKELRDKWERPKGKWHHSGECSVCHKRSYRTTPLGEIIGLDFTDFCKNCGAQMEVIPDD